MSGRKIAKSTVRKGIDKRTGKVRVTKPAKGILGKLIDQTLKKKGK